MADDASFWWSEFAWRNSELAEAARMRLNAIDRARERMRNPEQDRLDPAVLMRAGEQTIRRLEGPMGDFAQWVWAFEMEEPERELLRTLSPAHRLDVAAGVGLPPHFFASGAARLRRMARARRFEWEIADARAGDRPSFPLVEPREGAQPPQSSFTTRLAMLHWRASGALLNAWRFGRARLALGTAAFGALSLSLGHGWAACVVFGGLGFLAWHGDKTRSPWRRLLLARLRQAYPELHELGLLRECSPSPGSSALGQAIHDEEARAPAVGDEDGTLWARAYSTGAGPTPWPTLALRALAERSSLADLASEPARSGTPARL